MSVKRKDIGFIEWARLACKYDSLSMGRLLCVAGLLVCALLLPVVGVYLFCGLGLVFTLAFWHVYRRHCTDPPWWMRRVEDGKTHND
jgi:hypothetical protein